MSLDAQAAPDTGRHMSINGATASPNQAGEARSLDWCYQEASDLPVELPAIRGESAVRQLRQNGINRSNPPLRSVVVELAAADVSRPQRVLLTHVFSDIVASTETAERIGDRAWCALLLRHNQLVREHLRVHRGCEIDAAGDGFLMTFDCPSRAVQFAVAVRSALKRIGVVLRIGIHTGECEVVGGRVIGISVHAAARIVHAAGAGEILVSSTVRDLIAGSGYGFSKKDVQVLKGLSEPRQLFALD